MRTHRGVTIVVLAATLGGCATNMRWVRPGATAAQFDAEQAQCQYESQLATPGSYYGRGVGNAVAAGISDGLRIAELRGLCMRAKGWSLVQLAEKQ